MAAAKVIRLGIGMPQLFNDESIIPALINRGHSLEDARDYVAIGCVEPHSQGRSDPWSNAAMMNLAKVLEFALNDGKCRLTGRQFGLETGDPRNFSSFEEVMQAYSTQLVFFVRHMVSEINAIDLAHRRMMPRPVVSALVDGCLEKCKDIREGGAKYNFVGPQGVGVTDVGNSLAAIKKLVFEDKKLTMADVIDALDSGFKDIEDIRQMMLNAPKYGNDDDYVDLLCKEVALMYCREVEKYKNVRGGIYNPGLYPVSVNVPMGNMVGALPSGRKPKVPLADGISPNHGTDRKGPTAVIKSVTKIDHLIASNGTLLNMRFSPGVLETEKDLEKFVDFLRSYIDLKGHHVQFNVISSDTLRDAQKEPEIYRGLLVRVAGYSAFFTELDKRIQDDIIGRTVHSL
jgi:formate C-acetyltransferase